MCAAWFNVWTDKELAVESKYGQPLAGRFRFLCCLVQRDKELTVESKYSKA